MTKEKRFEIVYKQGKLTGYKIIKDTKTGVMYLFFNDGAYAGGLTPLLDPDGKPLVDAER
ncbi:MAG: DUF6440 family protein [Oscillospiraceae bacterium]|nr:DUF6440 family protein [Oscillospiraceae bacterium]